MWWNLEPPVHVAGRDLSGGQCLGWRTDARDCPTTSLEGLQVLGVLMAARRLWWSLDSGAAWAHHHYAIEDLKEGSCFEQMLSSAVERIVVYLHTPIGGRHDLTSPRIDAPSEGCRLELRLSCTHLMLNFAGTGGWGTYLSPCWSCGTLELHGLQREPVG